MGEVAKREPFAGAPQHKAEEGSSPSVRVLSGHLWIALRCQVIGQVCVGLGLAYTQRCQMLLAEV